MDNRAGKPNIGAKYHDTNMFKSDKDARVKGK